MGRQKRAYDQKTVPGGTFVPEEVNKIGLGWTEPCIPCSGQPIGLDPAEEAKLVLKNDTKKFIGASLIQEDERGTDKTPNDRYNSTTSCSKRKISRGRGLYKYQ